MESIVDFCCQNSFKIRCFEGLRSKEAQDFLRLRPRPHFRLIKLSGQGWRKEFSNRGLTLPTRGLKYGYQGIVNAKNLRQNSFSSSDGGLACSDRGL